MAEKTQIFRQQALDRINSPEQLHDYMKVTNPGIWIILAAVILLLGGMFAWASVGKLETTANAMAVIENGTATVMLTEAASSKITSEMSVRIESQDYHISTVKYDEYGRAVAYAPVALADGNYDAKIVIETISPLKFLFK
jgi:hypothetical protein